MKVTELVAILKQIDLFISFSDEELVSFAGTITEEEIDTETVLFEEGDSGSDMFILLEGSLKVLKENRTIKTIQPFDYIGEMAIIEDKPRSATVISNTPARLLKITSSQFQKYFSTQPKSLVSLMKTLSCRVRDDTILIANEFEKANILIHDMRNSITGLLLLDMLAKEDLTQTQKSHIALMQKCRNHLSEMIAEALANAKRLQYTPILQDNSLSELLAETLESAAIHPDLKDKKIQVSIDDTIPPFPFHKTDILRVFSNLLINAGQASSAGDTINIDVTTKDNDAVIKIVDHGCGIPKHIHSKIFLPHFTTKEKGSGFGLASCKQIIESKHQGTLTFESVPCSGTTFCFTLPMNLKC